MTTGVSVGQSSGRSGWNRARWPTREGVGLGLKLKGDWNLHVVPSVFLGKASSW